MSVLITIIVFIIIFSVLILAHEFGHFIMAKRAGILVEEFGFGLPPRIWGKKIGETIYSINWIPFGGFVKMLGEDAFDPRMLKKKRSFAGKSMRARFKVIVAGVLMNFLLAWILLSVGFTVGMQPLLTSDDVLQAVDDGQIQLAEGIKIKSVEKGGLFDEAGFKPDDVIYSKNGQVFDEYIAEDLIAEPKGVFKVLRDGNIFTYTITEAQITGKEKYGFALYDYVVFPRVKIYELPKGSELYKAGLRTGDVIITVNDHEVYSVEDFENIVRGVSYLDYVIYRNGSRQEYIAELSQIRKVIVSAVIPDMPAYKVGLEEGDVIISVNGKNFEDSLELIDSLKKNKGQKSAYLIEKEGVRKFLEIQPNENGEIGVYLSELMNYGSESGMSVYNTAIISSVIEIKNEQYPWYQAIYKSFEKGVVLAGLTGKMFVGFVVDLIKGGEVPATVAGPVGIAQMTHTFVSEGIISLLRFVAILSLSLAVINILPFPALDGGRLLFILIEFIIGRRIAQKWESAIHAFGYGLIILLLIAVTYSDITRLIFG